MTERALPSLALALAAATNAWLRLDEDAPRLGRAFVPAVAALDDVDRAYRRAIERRLPRASAGATLAAMAAFRERVHAVRERARRETDDIYRRFNRSYGGFDPLDPYLPPTGGLSHADGTRVATLADTARTEVDALRAQANAAVVQGLAPDQVEALIAAKRSRRAAFETALRRALETALAAQPVLPAAELDKTLAGLTRLADGWY